MTKLGGLVSRENKLIIGLMKKTTFALTSLSPFIAAFSLYSYHTHEKKTRKIYFYFNSNTMLLIRSMTEFL